MDPVHYTPPVYIKRTAKELERFYLETDLKILTDSLEENKKLEVQDHWLKHKNVNLKITIPYYVKIIAAIKAELEAMGPKPGSTLLQKA